MDEATIAELGPLPHEPPLRFGKRYRSLALLGSGGMGSVYLAEDEELGELVAVKVLRPELVDKPEMLERFRDEVRLARRVSSPLVARTHDLAEHEGRWFVTMQYVEGETLSTRLGREGRLAVSDIVPIARDVCDGLAAVHAAGIVHRDLKPGNVLMSTQGRAVLADFGIALRADSVGTETDGYGTPTYVAPEQLYGQAVDARADVFAAGALLYTLVTGQRPFPSERTGLEPPPDPRHAAVDVPEVFASLVMRAMALDPRDRFPSIEALRSGVDTVRPATSSAAHESRLPGFVRSLGAGRVRPLFLTVVAEDGVATGLTDAARADLLSRLRAGGHVRVVSSKDTAEAILRLRLSVREGAFVLELSLRSQRDGYQFWGESLEGPPTSLPRLIDRAAAAIERAFAPAATPMAETEAFPSADVGRLFLEGRAEYRAFWGDHLRRSVELFEKALALAPDHPLVIAWCSIAQSRRRFFHQGAGPHERSRELAQRAVDLAPELPDARIALAACYVQEMQVAMAVPHMVEALRLAPGLLDQRTQFARILHECGAIGPALALAENTFQADPSFSDPLEIIVRHYGLRGQLDVAARQLERATFERHSLINIGFLRYCAWDRDRGRFDAGAKELDYDRLDYQPKVMVDIYSALFAGESAPIEALTTIQLGSLRGRAFIAQLAVEVFGFMRDARRALDALDEAVGLGLYDIQWLDHCKLLDPLRGVSRFEAIRHTAHERAMTVLSEIERALGGAGQRDH